MMVALLMASLVLASCHKTCTCRGWDGSEREYSADEVEKMGGNCADIELIGNGAIYYNCSWS